MNRIEIERRLKLIRSKRRETCRSYGVVEHRGEERQARSLWDW